MVYGSHQISVDAVVNQVLTTGLLPLTSHDESLLRLLVEVGVATERRLAAEMHNLEGFFAGVPFSRPDLQRLVAALFDSIRRRPE
jgi:hypothetical protein